MAPFLCEKIIIPRLLFEEIRYLLIQVWPIIGDGGLVHQYCSNLVSQREPLVEYTQLSLRPSKGTVIIYRLRVGEAGGFLLRQLSTYLIPP